MLMPEKPAPMMATSDWRTGNCFFSMAAMSACIVYFWHELKETQGSDAVVEREAPPLYPTPARRVPGVPASLSLNSH